MVDVWHIMIGSSRNPSTETGDRRGGESVGGGRKREKGKREGSGLDITMIAGDENEKKGAGARRAVCGVQRPRVFQTVTDALRLVLSVRRLG